MLFHSPRRRWVLLLCLLASAAAAACGDGGDGAAGPGPDPAAFAEFAAAIHTVQSRYLDANEPALRSLAVLGPYIESALGSAAGSACLDALIAGRTFEFDGSMYVAGDSAGAPQNGVRFLLYPVNGAGTPDRTRPLGHFEIECRPDEGLHLEATLASAGVEILGAVVRGTSADPANLEMGGFVRTPEGNEPWLWGGSLVGGQFALTADLPGDVDILYAVLDQPGSTPDNVLVQALRSRDALRWELYADILASDSGEIREGPVRFTTPEGSDLAACMAGSVDLPVFLSPAAGGCSYFNLAALDPGEDDLNTLEGGYLVLRDLYLLSRRFVAIGLAGVDTAS